MKIPLQLLELVSTSQAAVQHEATWLIPPAGLLRAHSIAAADELRRHVQDNPTDILSAKEQQAKAVTWMDSILSLIPGRKQAYSNEPSDEAIRRTHDYLRCEPTPMSTICRESALRKGLEMTIFKPALALCQHTSWIFCPVGVPA